MSSLGLHLPSGRAYAPRKSPLAGLKSVFALVVKALHDSRMRKAQEIIAQHRHLLPADMENAGYKLDGRGDDHLPFVR